MAVEVGCGIGYTENQEIKKYVWLNPVVAAMAGDTYADLLKQLADRRFTVVTCDSSADKVRKEYRRRLQAGGERPIIDTRCPVIGQIVLRDYPELSGRLAPVLPILLMGAKALYHQFVETDPAGAVLTMVTPCQALATSGNELFGSRVQFVAWKTFYQEHGLECAMNRVDVSPIPPGFFRYPEYQVLEGSGNGSVRQLLSMSVHKPKRADLLELLYCEGGCHNGDGME